MKIILLFTCIITLLTSSGCLVADGGGRGHYEHSHYERHDEVRAVVVGPPVVVVRPPEVIVR
ncbi:MAG TPA: hypothetical protein VK815_07440 [Candidatus Acidoferrales bacterium]|jgi:hypothetical protein|nr:hypothetical protein [Candidatus Acidoferrales bacterium]